MEKLQVAAKEQLTLRLVTLACLLAIFAFVGGGVTCEVVDNDRLKHEAEARKVYVGEFLVACVKNHAPAECANAANLDD